VRILHYSIAHFDFTTGPIVINCTAKYAMLICSELIIVMQNKTEM